MTYFILQPPLVDRAKLFQQNHGIFDDLTFMAVQLHMRWQLRLVHLRCDRSTDHGRAVLISHIILDDQNRSYPALFRTDHRS